MGKIPILPWKGESGIVDKGVGKFVLTKEMNEKAKGQLYPPGT